MKKKVKLVDDWKNAWKWISVHAMLLAASIQGAWTQLPDDLKASLPNHLVSYSTVALLILGIIGRILKQGEEDNADKS